VPWYENTLSLQGVFSLNNGLGEDLTVVGNFGIHIVDKEWLGEVIFVVRVWHGFVVKGHHSSRFNISEFVDTSCGVGISVEKFG
jgi:hypothetical protein